MFRNLEAEQRRAGMTNTDVAEYLGVSRATYENKKKDGKFTRPEIVKLLRLFNCKFEYSGYARGEGALIDDQSFAMLSLKTG